MTDELEMVKQDVERWAKNLHDQVADAGRAALDRIETIRDDRLAAALRSIESRLVAIEARLKEELE